MFRVGDAFVWPEELDFIRYSENLKQLGEVVVGNGIFDRFHRGHRNRLDFGLDRFDRRVLDQCVAGRELEVSRDLPNPDHHPACRVLPGDASSAGWTPICDFGPSVLGLATGPWNDDLCRQSVRDIVFHYLEAALCLVVIEGQPKLVEPAVGEMEMLE